MLKCLLCAEFKNRKKCSLKHVFMQISMKYFMTKIVFKKNPVENTGHSFDPFVNCIMVLVFPLLFFAIFVRFFKGRGAGDHTPPPSYATVAFKWHHYQSASEMSFMKHNISLLVLWFSIVFHVYKRTAHPL